VPERSRSLYERAAIPLISSRAGSWFYVYVAPHLDRALLRVTGGQLTTAGRGRVGFLRVRGARTGVERQRLWELVNRRYPGYAVYQRRAGAREIPIMVLEPSSPEAQAQFAEASSS
jgi:F420H(2)-dependent quinone reductase